MACDLAQGEGKLANRRSLLTWGFILLILVGTGILTIAWPILQDNLTGASPISAGTAETIEIGLPIPMFGLDSISLQSWQLMLILAFLVIGAVVTTGIALMIISYLASRIINNTESSEDFKSSASDLEARNQAKLKEIQESQPTGQLPETVWSRWSIIATGLAIALFAVALANLFAHSLYPGGRTLINGSIVNMSALFSLIALALSVGVLALGLSTIEIDDVETVRLKGVPWDSIAVVLTGFLVVGLGIAAILILRVP